MIEPEGRFRLDELADDTVDLGAPGASGAEAQGALAVARALERVARAGDVAVTPGFADRVAAAIASEPLPAPVVAAGAAVRGRRMLALVGALGDAWRVAWGGPRPAAARAPAFALVLVMVVAVASIGGAATAGALGLFGSSATPNPVASSGPSQPAIVSTSSPSPTESAEPSSEQTPEPSESPGTSEPPGSPAPGQSAEPPGRTPGPTPEPTHTPGETHTPEPSQTPKPSDGGGSGGGSSGGGDGAATATPTE